MRIGLIAGCFFPAAVPGQEVQPRAGVTTRVPLDATSRIAKKELVGERRFTLKGWKGELKDARIIDLGGNDISAILSAKTEVGGVTMAQPVHPFIMKTRTPQVIALNNQSDTVLPGGMVIALAAQPDRGGATTAMWFRLFCSITPRPAPWNAAAGNYVTEMKFSVRPSEGAPATVNLPFPIAVSLEFEGMVAQNVPGFVITQAGLEHQKVVELRFRPSTMQPTLKVRSTISDSDLTIEALPRLELRLAKTTPLGFGLETVVIAVERIRSDGEPVAVAAAVNVDVQVRGAARREGAAAVVIPAGAARTEFVLRSAGLGGVGIEVTAGALTATTEINQRFPTGPLIAAVFGGALGGLARRWIKGARKRSAVRHLFEGTVVGLVGFVAAVLGVGYLHFPAAIAATEAGAFLTSTLGGFAGVTVLTAITDKLKPATGGSA